MTTVVTVGTSIEAGTWLNAGESWPSRLAQRAPSRTFLDRSLPGGAYTHNDSSGDNLRKHVDAAIALRPAQIILGGPVNDLVSLADITPLRQAVFDAGNAVTAAGIALLVMGVFPFTDGPQPPYAFPTGWWPSLEPRRSDYNTWAQQMYGTRFVDLTWCLHETTTWRGDDRWYLDGLHPTRVGAALLAECFPLERLV